MGIEESVLAEIDRRLTRIEASLSLTPMVEDSPNTRASKAITLSQKTAKQKTLSNNVHHQTSGRQGNAFFLGLCGLFFVVLAGFFLVKMAYASGWLNPTRQVILAASFGLLLFFVPDLFKQADRQYDFIAWLSGAGITILYCSVYGAYFYHHLLSGTWTLLLASIISFLGFYKIRTEDMGRIYSLVVMSGVYFATLLLIQQPDHFMIISLFLAIWNIGFVVQGIQLKQRELLFTASYMAVVFLLFLLSTTSQHIDYYPLMIFAFIHASIFFPAFLLFSFKCRTPMTSAEIWQGLFPLVLLFYTLCCLILQALMPAYAPWFGCLVSAITLFFYWWVKHNIRNALSLDMLATVVVLAAIHSIYFNYLGTEIQILTGLIIWVALLCVPLNYFKQYQWSLFAIFITIVPYLHFICLFPYSAKYAVFSYNIALGFVNLYFVCRPTSAVNSISKLRFLRPYIMGISHLCFMVGSYRWLYVITEHSILFVSIFWAFYTSFVGYISYVKKDRMMANSVLLLIGILSLKALFYDIRFTDHYVRVLCLLFEGLLLYAAAWLYKALQSWRNI